MNDRTRSDPGPSHDETGTGQTAGPVVGEMISRGAVAGLSAGLGFILANMWFALAVGKPAVAPFLAISTIFDASSMPQPGPVAVVTGVVLHGALSIAFGVGFALLLTAVPRLHTPGLLAPAALIYGLALWVLDFQILGRTVFAFFTSPAGPNQIFELIIHPLIFGLLLVPFFLPRLRQPRGQRS